jgi:ankyrin repeat protein
MVAPDSPLFQCVRTGDHKGIQALISGGTASIADISAPYGYSALTTALLYGQMDVAYFLLRQGAPQIISDGSWTLNPGLIYDHFLSCSLIDLNISASQTMSEYRRVFTTEWRQQTLYLHLQSSMLQDLGFSRLHKAVLKISLEEVGKAASAPIVDLDHVDRLGRTALYWASAIGDEEAMRTLLFIGADPAKADPHGVGPIHVSASSKATACVRMLLEAGVCPHQSDNIGNTALHYASAAGSVSVLALILDATSNPNIGTVLGEPSIFYVKFSGEDKTAQLLIDRGASVTIQDKWGYDAILDAVYSDAHDILSIFLGRGLSTQKCLIDGKNILHVAALNSDRRTIELLSAFDFRGIYSESRDQAGYTALDYMRQRRRNEDVWDPFCALLLKVESDNVDAGTKSLYSSNFDIFYDAEEYHIAI